MIARVARFEGVDTEAARNTLATAEPIVRSLMEGVSGYRGRGELVGPEGEVISLAFFDSEEQAADAEAAFDEELPRQLGTLFDSWKGRRVSVGHYSVVVDDFAGSGTRQET